MKIGIIFFSRSGHTRKLAASLKDKLAAAGHDVILEKLDASGSVRAMNLNSRPPVDAYEGVVFGSPVWGHRMVPAVQMYLNQLTSLKGKKVVCMTTQMFPVKFGGVQTIAAMKSLCESKGAVISGTGSINWFGFGWKRKISDLTDQLAALFKA